MRSFIAAAALLGLSTLTSAAPTPSRDRSNPFPGGAVLPLVNGFPNPNTEQKNNIFKQAFGTLPNGPPPPSISQEGLTNLKLVCANEQFEVAYFTELLFNITTGVSGYDQWDSPSEKDYVVRMLTATQAVSRNHSKIAYRLTNGRYSKKSSTR